MNLAPAPLSILSGRQSTIDTESPLPGKYSSSEVANMFGGKNISRWFNVADVTNVLFPGTSPTTLCPWEGRRAPSSPTPRRPSSTRRGPRRPRRSTLRGRRTPRLSRVWLMSSWEVRGEGLEFYYLFGVKTRNISQVASSQPSPPGQASAAELTDTFWRGKSWSSTSGRSRPRRGNRAETC